jgi:hypothetical protein
MSQQHCDITQAVITEIATRHHKVISVVSTLIAIR